MEEREPVVSGVIFAPGDSKAVRQGAMEIVDQVAEVTGRPVELVKAETGERVGISTPEGARTARSFGSTRKFSRAWDAFKARQAKRGEGEIPQAG